MTAMDFPASPTLGQEYNGYVCVDATNKIWDSLPYPIGGLPAGSIMPWPSDIAPANWAIMNGQALSRVTAASLFALIGTTYGAGDGSTTFNVPDWRDRSVVGKGTTYPTLGALVGSASHRHGFRIGLMDNGAYGVAGPNAAMGSDGDNSGGAYKYSTGAYAGATVGNTRSSTGQVAGSVSTRNITTYDSVGDTTTASNLSPSAVANWVIKTTSGFSAGDSELATRVGALEAAPAGLVRVVPTSVAVGSGSSSVTSTGLVTFTGATYVQLNNCFKTDYRNFRFQFKSATSGLADIYFKPANGGSVVNAANIYTAGTNIPTSGTSTNISGFNSLTYGYLMTNNGAALSYTSCSGDIMSPNISDVTTFTNQAMSYIAGVYSAANITSMVVALSSHDGIYIYPSGGTFSGQIQVYGYRN